MDVIPAHPNAIDCLQVALAEIEAGNSQDAKRWIEEAIGSILAAVQKCDELCDFADRRIDTTSIKEFLDGG